MLCPLVSQLIDKTVGEDRSAESPAGGWMVPGVCGLKRLWLEFEGRFAGSLGHRRQSRGLGRGH